MLLTHGPWAPGPGPWAGVQKLDPIEPWLKRHVPGPGPWAHLGPGPLGPGPLGQDDGQDDEVCIPRMIDRMMGKCHVSIFLLF